MSFHSEIRPSQINELIEKVQSNNYGKFLKKITITARAFQDKPIVFNFPVTAIVGINGGGKTTVLGAAACAYKTIKPSLFFTKSGRFDSSMQNWKFEYELIDKEIKASDIVRRTAKFTHSRWSRSGLEREVAVFGVSRTVPANERPELNRCASQKFDVLPENIDRINIAQVIRSIRNTNRDPHLLFSQVGKKLGFLPEERVKEAFITLWVRNYKEEVQRITQPFEDKFPLESSQLNISR